MEPEQMTSTTALDLTHRMRAKGPTPRTAGLFARPLVLIGFAVAMALLFAFYAIVSHAVSRAQASRESAHAALDRQVVCSAFTTSSSRELCLLTVASRAPAEGLADVTYRLPVVSAQAMQVGARSY
jgi:hypothetical protein